MEWTLRKADWPGAALVMAVGAALLAPAASAAPRVDSVRLDGPAVVGRDAELSTRAVDPAAPVNGAVATFPNDGTVGSSACSASSDGRPVGPFAPGRPLTVTLPQVYGVAGPQDGSLRLDSGGCRELTGSVSQGLRVTATRPGARPVPIRLLGLPTPIDLTRPGGLSLPGVGELPPLPVLGTLSVDRTTAGMARRCRGANRSFGGSRRARKRARVAVLCLVNRQRQRRGLRRLKPDPRLRSAAGRHTRAMVKRSFFAHVAPGGVDLVDRLYRARYLPGRRWIVGENLAAGAGRGGYVTPARVVSAWMRSTGHRHVILTRQYREAGIGLVPSAPVRRGRRRPAATVTFDFGFKR